MSLPIIIMLLSSVLLPPESPREVIAGRLWCVDVSRDEAIIRTTGKHRRTVRVPIVPDRCAISVGDGPPTPARLRAISEAWRDSQSVLFAWYYPDTSALVIGIVAGRDVSTVEVQ